MSPLKVFVASSTEGEPIARELRKLLQAELGGTAVVEMWREKFEFSDTAIESLENVAEDADFAVLLMTGDDVTVSRTKESVAPRDNLIFELGLFIGSLGRNRAFVVREGGNQLKLPTDILSVTAVTYDAGSRAVLSRTLKAQCTRLSARMTKEGLRPKWLAEGRAALKSNGEFCGRLTGAWWERISQLKGSALSYFTIYPDATGGTVTLDGTGYSLDGKTAARWKSEMVRLYPSERTIAYLWRGSHPLPGRAHFRFHGYGTMEFDPPEGSSPVFSRGKGTFWDVNEAEPGDTVSKAIELRRVVDMGSVAVMTAGAAGERRELVQKTLDAW